MKEVYCKVSEAPSKQKQWIIQYATLDSSNYHELLAEGWEPFGVEKNPEGSPFEIIWFKKMKDD